MPTSVTIPQGSSTKTFQITAKAVPTSQSTTITASLGSVSLQQNLIVSPIALESIYLTQSMVTGGALVSGVVRIAVPAPSGGLIVNLSSTYPTVAMVPTSITIAQGTTSATFTTTTYPVGQTYFVTISARHASSSVATQLQVVPPEVSSFRLSATTVRGGNTVTGTVVLTGRAPAGGLVVQVFANPFLASPASTVTVPAGANSISFTINTSHVSVNTPVQLSAMTFNVVKSVTLTLTP